MKLTLGIDTATEDTVVAAVCGDQTLYEEIEGPAAGRPLHGPALLPMIERAVEATGGWAAVDRIAVGLGPGSFTGLRVGIATAQALGRSAGVEVTGVPTLDALAAGADSGGHGSSSEVGLEVGAVMAAIDARRGQVFVALYERGGESADRPGKKMLKGPFVCDPGRLASCLNGGEPAPAIAVGSGALRFRDQFEAAGMVVPGAADPLHTVSGRCIASIGALTQRPVEPIYLRAPDAEQWLERARTEKERS